jgi:hypothetical protein
VAAKAKAAKEKRRVDGINRTRAEETEKIEQLQENLRKRDGHVEQLRLQQAQAHEERLLREQLEEIDKAELIRRIRRREEYARLSHVAKVQTEEEKAQQERESKARNAIERQANQRKQALVKWQLEEQLATLKKAGDVNALGKLAGRPSGAGEEGKQ